MIIFFFNDLKIFFNKFFICFSDFYFFNMCEKFNFFGFMNLGNKVFVCGIVWKMNGN